MILDVAYWHPQPHGCHRCGREATHYVRPYWRRDTRICAICCQELNWHYDKHGWPDEGRLDG